MLTDSGWFPILCVAHRFEIRSDLNRRWSWYPLRPSLKCVSASCHVYLQRGATISAIVRYSKLFKYEAMLFNFVVRVLRTSCSHARFYTDTKFIQPLRYWEKKDEGSSSSILCVYNNILFFVIPLTGLNTMWPWHALLPLWKESQRSFLSVLRMCKDHFSESQFCLIRDKAYVRVLRTFIAQFGELRWLPDRIFDDPVRNGDVRIELNIIDRKTPSPILLRMDECSISKYRDMNW